MTLEQLEWLLMVISNAPIQTLEQARFKAVWLAEIASRLEALNEISK